MDRRSAGAVIFEDNVLFVEKDIAGFAVAQALCWALWEPRVTFWLPQPIFTQNGSNDVDSRKDVPFAVKITTFHTSISRVPKRSKCKFLDLENFRPI